MSRAVVLGRCESCGTTKIPLLYARAKLDGEDHIFCPTCWKRDWRTISQDEANMLYDINDDYKTESAQPLPDDVLAAIGRPPVKHLRGSYQTPHPWQVTCVTPGCSLTALYKSVSCAEHTAPQRETPTP